jgi:hypothetical protein
MSGAFSRLTILFKPLGLNHFMDQNLSAIMGSEPGLFTAWDLPADLLEAASPIEQLEDFLCRIYRPL